MILLLYVDDIILTGSSLAVLRSLIYRLSSQFSMKDLVGVLFYLSTQGVAIKWFLKMEIVVNIFPVLQRGFTFIWYAENHVVQPLRSRNSLR